MAATFVRVIFQFVYRVCAEICNVRNMTKKALQINKQKIAAINLCFLLHNHKNIFEQKNSSFISSKLANKASFPLQKKLICHANTIKMQNIELLAAHRKNRKDE